jgi:hypothetical protein
MDPKHLDLIQWLDVQILLIHIRLATQFDNLKIKLFTNNNKPQIVSSKHFKIIQVNLLFEQYIFLLRIYPSFYHPPQLVNMFATFYIHLFNY